MRHFSCWKLKFIYLSIYLALTETLLCWRFSLCWWYNPASPQPSSTGNLMIREKFEVTHKMKFNSLTLIFTLAHDHHCMSDDIYVRTLTTDNNYIASTWCMVLISTIHKWSMTYKSIQCTQSMNRLTDQGQDNCELRQTAALGTEHKYNYLLPILQQLSASDCSKFSAASNVQS